MEISELKEKIGSCFSDLKFNEPTHEYLLENQQCVSVTTLLKKLENFNKDYWSKKKAAERGVSQEDILKEWNDIGKKATESGTRVHLDLENNGSTETADQEYRDTIVAVSKILNDQYDIIARELRMYLKVEGFKIPLAGTCDVLAYNKEKKVFALLDYKTGKPIEKNPTYIDKKTGEIKFSTFKLNFPFEDYPNSNYWKYSIQLSLYAYMLKKKLNLNIEEVILIHIDKFNKFTFINATLIPESMIDLLINKYLNDGHN